MTTRGFFGGKRPEPPKPIPPGQYLTRDFPVLSAGPTPKAVLNEWTFDLQAEDGSQIATWTWEAFLGLEHTTITKDIHCVTKWSKLDTTWEGITVDTLLDAAGIEPPGKFLMAFCDGGYTTNVPLEDLVEGKGMVAFKYEGADLAPEHGGPARLVVPHLYFWKSAKWVRGLRFMSADQPGYWEMYGYHMYGDPWREQRYWGD